MITLKELREAIERTEQADRILDKIWTHYGPYNRILSPEITNDLQKYFSFDDSE